MCVFLKPVFMFVARSAPTGMFQSQHYLDLTSLMDKESKQSVGGDDTPKICPRTHTHYKASATSQNSNIHVRLDTNVKLLPLRTNGACLWLFWLTGRDEGRTKE